MAQQNKTKVIAKPKLLSLIKPCFSLFLSSPPPPPFFSCSQPQKHLFFRRTSCFASMEKNNTSTRNHPSPINSPRGASSSNNNDNNNNGVVQVQLQIHHSNNNHTPPLTPIPISRSTEANPYPTTFVQADTNSFKQVVQLLTGSSETAAKQASTSTTTDPSNTNTNNNNNKSFVIPPIKTTTPKKQNFKLYERRANNFKNSLMINTLANNCAFSPRNGNNKPEILSPSLLDFPKLALSSPVTPLNEDPFNKSSPYSLGGNSSSSSSSEEERAIAEKGFYLHPSPMSTPRDHEPQLLTLFPLTSPRVSGSSSWRTVYEDCGTTGSVLCVLYEQGYCWVLITGRRRILFQLYNFISFSYYGNSLLFFFSFFFLNLGISLTFKIINKKNEFLDAEVLVFLHISVIHIYIYMD